MIIRQATAQDAHQIAVIHVKTQQHAYADFLPDEYFKSLSIEQKAAKWNNGLQKTTNNLLVAEKNGKILGWIGFGPNGDNDLEHAGEIWVLYIHWENLRTGIGRALVSAVETKLWNEKYSCISVWVFENNVTARAFYTKLGYDSDGKKSKYSIEKHDFMEIRYIKKANPINNEVEYTSTI